MTDTTAAQTGSENTSGASTGADTGGKGGTEKSVSVRASVERALAAAEVLDSPPPNQTDQARAVLKDGAGADEKMVGEDGKRREKAAETLSREQEREARRQEADRDKGSDKDKAGEKDRDADKSKASGKDEGKEREKAADKDKAGEKDKDEKGQRERDERGQFKASDDKGEKEDKREIGGTEDTDDKVSDPPKRMSEAAKAVWKNAPKEVRGDFHRVVRELEGGLAKHQESAGKWSALNEAPSPVLDKDGRALTYGELAKQMNTTIDGALNNYVAADLLLSKNPIAGVEQLLAARGLDFAKVAEAYLDMSDTERKDMRDRARLQQENEQLKRDKGAGATAQEQAARRHVDAKIQEFYDANPRLASDKELEQTFGKLYISGVAKTLDEALELAELKHPRTGPKTDSPDTADQTRKSELSDSGTRTTASDAASRRERSKTPRESAVRALRDVGL